MNGHATRSTLRQVSCAMLAACLFLSAMPARAYTDPGSGILLWQLILAGVAGFLFYLRRFLYRVRDRLAGKPNTSTGENQRQ